MMLARFFKISLLLLYASLLNGQHISAEMKKNASVSLFSLPFSTSSLPTKQTALLIQADGPIEGRRSEKTIFTCHVKTNKLNGRWLSYHPNGQIMDSGYFIKGIPHGIWKVWDQEGHLLKVRQYDADLFFRMLEDLKTKHPKFQKFILTSRYINEGEEALYCLSASYSFNNTGINDFTSLESLVSNNSQFITIYHPPFIYCLHNGLFINYNEKGNTTDSGYFRNGLREDIWIHDNVETRSVEKGTYRKGNKYNIWKTYDYAGKLIRLSYYNEAGKKEWEKEK